MEGGGEMRDDGARSSSHQGSASSSPSPSPPPPSSSSSIQGGREKRYDDTRYSIQGSNQPFGVSLLEVEADVDRRDVKETEQDQLSHS